MSNGTGTAEGASPVAEANMEIKRDEQGVFKLYGNKQPVQRGGKLRWTPTGSAIAVTFPAGSPFKYIRLDVPDGKTGTLIAPSPASRLTFKYTIVTKVNDSTIGGVEGDEPTIIIDDDL
jgi:hypothetical protein